MKNNHAPQIGVARLPTCQEWDALLDAVGGADGLLHWMKMYSWCQDANHSWALGRAVRGCRSARTRNYYDATYRYMTVGFRPAFDALDPDLLGPDGTIVTVGTLYMDGQPVRIPQNPVWAGDIQKYVPNAKLELREALEDSAYQVKAIKAGNSLIADRVLLWDISWDDLARQGFINLRKPKEEKNMDIIVFTDARYGNFAVSCSPENQEKVRRLIEERYPKWVAAGENAVGLDPCSYVVSAVWGLQELLGDEKLEFIPGCTMVALHGQN